MAKTLTFGAMHVVTSFSVTYLITGSVAMSGAVTFIEPIVNTVVHYFFDRAWERREHNRGHRAGHANGVSTQPGAADPLGQAATSPA